MATVGFEKLHVYKLAEDLADFIWDTVDHWNGFARDTVGKQLVKAADSIGANIAEGSGRGSYQDNKRFTRIGRASLYETKHWLRRAYRRNLMTESQTAQIKKYLDELVPRLNAYLRSIGKVKDDAPPPSPSDDK